MGGILHFRLWLCADQRVICYLDWERVGSGRGRGTRGGRGREGRRRRGRGRVARRKRRPLLLLLFRLCVLLLMPLRLLPGGERRLLAEAEQPAEALGHGGQPLQGRRHQTHLALPPYLRPRSQNSLVHSSSSSRHFLTSPPSLFPSTFFLPAFR